MKTFENAMPRATRETITRDAHGRRRIMRSTVREASPDLLQSLRPRRSHRRTFRRVSRRLSSPLVWVIALSVMVGAGAYIWTLLAEQRLERTLMTPKMWPAATVALREPVTAGLTTHHGGAFLHYTFTVRPEDADAAELEETLASTAFTIRLLDQDGFTILAMRPTDGLTLDTSGARPIFRLEDIVGCSPQVYARAAAWSVEWEGKASRQ